MCIVPHPFNDFLTYAQEAHFTGDGGSIQNKANEHKDIKPYSLTIHGPKYRKAIL